MRLFALCILIASLATYAVGQKSKPSPNAPTNSSQDAADSKYPTTQVIVQPEGNQHSPDQENGGSKSKHQGFLPKPEVVSAWSTFFILLTTILYAGISYCMWRKLGDQVKQAQASTDALIDIERPWIQVLISRIDIPPLPHSPSQPFVYIWPQIGSVGRTPARTKYAVFAKRLIPKDHNLPQNVPPPLPEKPDFSGGVSLEKHNLVIPHTGIEPMPVEVTVEDWDAVKKRELFLYVYGVVQYYGVGGKDRGTGFCAIYWVPYGKSDPQPEGFLTSANIPDSYIWAV